MAMPKRSTIYFDPDLHWQGDFRILYEIQDDVLIVYVLQIGTIARTMNVHVSS
jgi:hypothetical protein